MPPKAGLGLELYSASSSDTARLSWLMELKLSPSSVFIALFAMILTWPSTAPLSVGVATLVGSTMIP